MTCTPRSSRPGVGATRIGQMRTGCSLKLWSNGPNLPMATRHTLACARWQWNMISSDVLSAHATAALIGDTWLTTTMSSRGDPCRELLARRPDPGVEGAEALAALGGDTSRWSATTATPRAAPRQPAHPRTRRRPARSSGRRSRPAARSTRRSPGHAPTSSRSRCRPGRPTPRWRPPACARSRRAAGRADPAATRRRWPPCGRGGPGRARAQ